MSSGQHVRLAQPDDAEAIQDCLLRAFAEFRDAYPPAAFADTVLETREQLERRLQEARVYVMTDADDRVVGTISWSHMGPEEGHIRGMAVRPDLRGAGLANQLLATVEDDMRALGCRTATLDTTEPLARAIAFYEKHGYRRSGEPGDFFGMRLLGFAKAL